MKRHSTKQGRASGAAQPPRPEGPSARSGLQGLLRRAWPVVTAALTQVHLYPTHAKPVRKRLPKLRPVPGRQQLVTLRIGLGTNSFQTTTARLVGWRKIVRTA